MGVDEFLARGLLQPASVKARARTTGPLDFVSTVSLRDDTSGHARRQADSYSRGTLGWFAIRLDVGVLSKRGNVCFRIRCISVRDVDTIARSRIDMAKAELDAHMHPHTFGTCRLCQHSGRFICVDPACA